MGVHREGDGADIMANPTCKCYSKIAYRVTAEDIPEADPETFKEYDVYESCGLQVSTPKREFRPGHDRLGQFQASLDCIYRIEQRLLVFLQISVVRQGQALDQDQQRPAGGDGVLPELPV